VVVVVAVALIAVGCGGAHKIKTPKGTKIEAPGWYMDPPNEEDRLVGVASATSLDLQTAVDKARQDGRLEIARQLDLRMTGMAKRFVEETGLAEDAELLDMFTQVSKSIVSDSLNGSRVTKQELMTEGGVYRAYALVEMPIGEANAAFLAKIQAQQRLYTRFRASQAFEELDRSVREYEEWKRQQYEAMGE
jgi:hypothetical protein